MSNSFPQVLGQLKPSFAYKFWASIGHEGQTLDDLIEKMEALGNTILEVDEDNQRVMVAKWDETQDRWGCSMCLMTGSIVITDSEDELRAHLDNVHPGWEEEEN